MRYHLSDQRMYPKKDLVGVRYGRAMVVAFSGREKGRGQPRWDCVCDCGKIFTTPGYSLANGYTKSCGCFGRDLAKERVFRHGLCKTEEYRIHAGMLARCYAKTNKAYKNYGGRGIKLCPQWLGKSGFEQFLADMGPRPSKSHSIDRIDNDGPYSPDNCRWATKQEQARNKRTTLIVKWRGKDVYLGDICAELGLKYITVKERLRQGWELERALGTKTNERMA